ncbi:MAG TPA: HAMP domain-containing sensor histidine kinase [Pseudonocardiaceae bacterium]|jgi:signal transduction histidine kinase|nr:HAMP domain-containing sensor histidine kinase [Pseudonocardiaceae bacterium]
MRTTIRVRLAAWYTALTVLTGLILLAVTFLFVVPALPTLMAPAMTSAGLARRDQFVRLPQAVTEVVNVRSQVGASLLTWGGLTLLGLALASACVGWLLAGRVLRPVRAVTDTARRVAERHLHERIGLTGPADELKELADTFDSMVERLERSFDGQRRFIANASHELRTPLTTTRALVEVAVAAEGSSADTLRLGDKLLTVIAGQERLLDGLLALAHSETTIDRDTRIDLAELAAEAAHTHTGAALDAGIDLRTALSPAPLHGDPALLGRVVHNLIDNAIRYNVAATGWVAIHSGTSPDGAATLTVANSGSVIEANEVDSLFEPFRRVRYDRTHQPRGSGLGLSVVRAVVRAHHGTVEASPRNDGGLTLRVTIPARAETRRTVLNSTQRL